jgi:hypothetical protein
MSADTQECNDIVHHGIQVVLDTPPVQRLVNVVTDADTPSSTDTVATNADPPSSRPRPYPPPPSRPTQVPLSTAVRTTPSEMCLGYSTGPRPRGDRGAARTTGFLGKVGPWSGPTTPPPLAFQACTPCERPIRRTEVSPGLRISVSHRAANGSMLGRSPEQTIDRNCDVLPMEHSHISFVFVYHKRKSKKND